MAVNVLMAAQPITIAFFATAGQRLSVYIGILPLPTFPPLPHVGKLCAFTLVNKPFRTHVSFFTRMIHHVPSLQMGNIRMIHHVPSLQMGNTRMIQHVQSMQTGESSDVCSTGRVQVLLLLRLVGFSAMGVMGLFTSLWTNAPVIVTIFLIRTGVNNAGYPIQKAVLMDHVPKVCS